MLTAKQRAQTAARQRRFRQRQQEARGREQQQKGLPPLPAITSMPGHARWQAAFQWAQALLRQVQEEMSAYYEARSETWQEGEAGAEFVERQEALEAVVGQQHLLLRLVGVCPAFVRRPHPCRIAHMVEKALEARRSRPAKFFRPASRARIPSRPEGRDFLRRSW